MLTIPFLLWTALAGQKDPGDRASDAVFRSNTRVLTIDVMVEDLQTRAPVEGLTKDDFRLKLDGKERPLSYFGRDGSRRRPLAMILYVNLAPEGGLRELSQPGVMESVARALARLEPEDEVGLIAANDWFVGRPQEVVALTRDRDAVLTGMRRSIEAAIGLSSEDRGAERVGRENSMSNAIARVQEAASTRPDSQVALVYISDGMNTLDTMETRQRRALASSLQRLNISLSALELRMMATYKAAATVLNPLGVAFGLSVTGSNGYLAKQSGGITVEVPSPGELGQALSQVVTSYVSRYSLGYQLTEAEFLDGGLHRVDVVLVGKAAKGREVSARKSFAVESGKR